MKKKILFVFSLLFGLIFINAGLNKFFNYMPVPDDLPENLINMSAAMMEIGWLMPLVAVAELTGVVYHTYSTYARGAEFLLGFYPLLDVAPHGRNEGDPPEFWIRRHDEYDRKS